MRHNNNVADALQMTRLRQLNGLEDDDYVYRLNPCEKSWVHLQPFLKEKGYTLRPRYRLDWVPSWTSNGEEPADCEDSWELPVKSAVVVPKEGELTWDVQAVKRLDAVREEDGKHVCVKMSIPTLEGQEARNELEVLQYLAQDGIKDDPRNHALMLLDTFPIPRRRDENFIVTPFLSKWNVVPFKRIGELTDFMHQILEGIQFLHSHHIAHRDVVAANIMMDASALYGEPFHPCDFYSSLDGQRRLEVKSRSEGSVRYFFIDFGLSVRFPRLEDRGLVTGEVGHDQSAPELLHPVPAPYDPFKLDIYIIGEVIDRHVVKKYQGFEGLESFIEQMMAENPSARPDADKALALYLEWENSHGNIVKSCEVVPLESSQTLFPAV